MVFAGLSIIITVVQESRTETRRRLQPLANKDG